MATSMTDYSNNTISQIVINNTTYDITDATTRSIVSNLDSKVQTLENSLLRPQLNAPANASTPKDLIDNLANNNLWNRDYTWVSWGAAYGPTSGGYYQYRLHMPIASNINYTLFTATECSKGSTYVYSYKDNKWNGYALDIDTNNTTDTWVPVFHNGNTIQHRFIPAKLVTGVKGNKESTYRTGDVNLTAANIGAMDNNYSETSNVTVPSNLVVNWGSLPLYKIGRIVTLLIKGFKAQAKNTAVNFGTLPEAYRPVSDIVYSLQDPSRASVRFTIKSTGVVECYNYDKNPGEVFNFNGHPIVWASAK